MRRAIVPRSRLRAHARPPSAVPTGSTSTPPVSLAATRAPRACAQSHGARPRSRPRVVRGCSSATALPLSEYNAHKAAPQRNGTGGAQSGRDVLVGGAGGQRYLEIPIERADGAHEQEDEEQHTANLLRSDED